MIIYINETYRTWVSFKRSNGQKITNNTNIYGIMGGLAPMKNISAATHISYKIGHARLHQDIPLDPEEGLEYMLGDNPMGKYLLSKNPHMCRWCR